MKAILLNQIAYARSGDKGDNANIGVIAHTKAGYEQLLKHLTIEAVQNYFQGLFPQKVERFELPNLLAVNFVLHGVLDGGGNRSLRIDAQGKTLGQAILLMPLQLEENILSDCMPTMGPQ